MDRPYALSLSQDDRETLDALVDSGFDPQRLPPEQRARGEKLLGLMHLMDHLPAPGGTELLVERTIQRIEQVRQQDRRAQDAIGVTGPVGSIHWSEMLGAAAVLIVGLSLAMPLLSQHRAESRQAACQANLALAGLGFSGYAADHGGAMPAMQAQTGDPWWHINRFDAEGRPHSNSAHAFLLIRKGYLDAAALSCAGNPEARVKLSINMRDWPSAEAISFSYQNQFSPQQPRWGENPSIAVLADKNPLFTDGRQRRDISPDAASPNHDGLGGQNVLMNDGHVAWIRTPMLNNGDLIWHVGSQPQSEYRGTETPVNADDSFLVP